MIKNYIKKNKPLMVARLGATESKAVIYPKLPWVIKKIFKNIIFNRMFKWSGFFPVNDDTINSFSQIYKNDLKIIDILVSWRLEEKLINEIKSQTKKIKLEELEPYLSKDPWSKYLKGKKVLVIHPFDETIKKQYLNRKKLFLNKDVLPKFELITIKAILSLSGENKNFRHWFEALDYMKNEINNKEFDIALIGCGAYGLPLAAHVKRIGKIGIHMGGCLQILFGIKGKRWDNHKIISNLYNVNWVRPSEEDKPLSYKKVEDGCYW
jgi:hypothetical protein